MLFMAKYYLNVMQIGKLELESGVKDKGIDMENDRSRSS